MGSAKNQWSGRQTRRTLVMGVVLAMLAASGVGCVVQMPQQHRPPVETLGEPPLGDVSGAAGGCLGQGCVGRRVTKLSLPEFSPPPLVDAPHSRFHPVPTQPVFSPRESYLQVSGGELMTEPPLVEMPGESATAEELPREMAPAYPVPKPISNSRSSQPTDESPADIHPGVDVPSDHTDQPTEAEVIPPPRSSTPKLAPTPGPMLIAPPVVDEQLLPTGENVPQANPLPEPAASRSGSSDQPTRSVIATTPQALTEWTSPQATPKIHVAQYDQPVVSVSRPLHRGKDSSENSSKDSDSIATQAGSTPPLTWRARTPR